MKAILKYFPELTTVQKEQFAQLENLYKEWNAQINVVSRKDIDELYIRHVLHSLGIAKVQKFEPGSSVIRYWNWRRISGYSTSHFISRNGISFGRFHWKENKSCKWCCYIFI